MLKTKPMVGRERMDPKKSDGLNDVSVVLELLSLEQIRFSVQFEIA